MALRDLIKEMRAKPAETPGEDAASDAPAKRTRAPKATLIPRIHAYLKKKNEEEPGRPPGLHPSGLWNLCPRMLWLAQRFPKEGEAVPIVPDIENPKLAQMLQKNRVDPELQVKFDIGHISHDLLQNQYLGPAGLLWGSWACSACGVIGAVDTTYPQMPHCQVAATNAGADKIEKKVGPAAVGDQNREAVLPWRYVEPPIRVATGGFVISGYCDGIIMLNGVKSVVEAKTINSRGFSALKEPHEDHVYQLQLYLAALRMEKGYVLYLDKDTQKMKEFEVIRDDSVLPKIIAKIQLALAVQRGQVATAPDRVCASPGETRAKYACPWAEMCFDSLASAWTVEGKPL